jgi:general secretion pathway protein K
MALVMVVWALSLLAVMVMAMAGDAHSSLVVTRNRLNAAQARSLAEGGVWWAVDQVVNGDPHTDGRLYPVVIDGHTVAVSLRDDSGKIDLNKAPAELLAGLLRQSGVGTADAGALAAAIVDFRTRSPAFEVIEDLRRVAGFTPELFQRLAPSLTVMTGDARINPRMASRQVLLSVPGMDERSADAFLRARSDDAPPPPSGLPGGTESYFTGRTGSAISIRATARLDGGARYVQEALVERVRTGKRPYRIDAWRQGIESGDD